MSLQEISSIITICAIILAGIWTLYRFGLTRERYPKLQFELGMNKLGKSRDKSIVEFVATITNKGLTRQYITDFKFRVLSYDDTMAFDMSDEEIEKQLKFQKNTGDFYWQKPDHNAFVDGGMTRQFTHVTALDANIRFVMIYSKFINQSQTWFMKKPEKYYISKTFAV